MSLIDDAVRRATVPLERAVAELSARLAAVEGAGGQPDAETPKKAPRGRTARAQAQPAEASADYPPVGLTGDVSETVPEQRKGADR